MDVKCLISKKQMRGTFRMYSYIKRMRVKMLLRISHRWAETVVACYSESFSVRPVNPLPTYSTQKCNSSLEKTQWVATFLSLSLSNCFSGWWSPSLNFTGSTNQEKTPVRTELLVFISWRIGCPQSSFCFPSLVFPWNLQPKHVRGLQVT